MIAATQLYFAAVFFATETGSFFSSASEVSTPFVETSSPARYDISERFPLSMLIFTFSSIRFAVSFLKFDAPAPTGSKTTGTPSSLAFFPAATIDSTVLALRVPMFITRAFEIEVISAASAISSAMIGEAPMARMQFATSFTVT